MREVEPALQRNTAGTEPGVRRRLYSSDGAEASHEAARGVQDHRLANSCHARWSRRTIARLCSPADTRKQV